MMFSGLAASRVGILVCLCCFVFFFKQKTAYEMRISDWSSDVCSSDLKGGAECLFVDAFRYLSPVSLRCCRCCIAGDHARLPFHVRCAEIGRASCRERVCQYV